MWSRGSRNLKPAVKQCGGIPCGYHQCPPRLPDFLHDCCAAAQMARKHLKTAWWLNPVWATALCALEFIKSSLVLDLEISCFPSFYLFMCLGHCSVWSPHINNGAIKNRPMKNRPPQQIISKHRSLNTPRTSISVEKSQRRWKPHYALCFPPKAACVTWLCYFAHVKML